MLNVISSAYAQTGGAPNQQGGSLSFFLMMLVFFLFIYFAIWRPQSKRAKEQQNLLNSLAKGDEVVMAGGLLGRIVKMTDSYMTVAIANNVEVIIQKSSIASLLPKGTLKTLE